MNEYKATISFEKDKHCLYCPFIDIEDNCTLQDIEIDDPINFDWEAQMEHCPLVPVEYATWIGISDGVADGKPVYDRWECSECGYYAGEEKPKWSFCPNCGKPIWKGEL
jgi:hypothetical protein